MTEHKPQTEIDRELRELALTDRIIGLEAEVARLNVQAGLNDKRVLYGSREWKIGKTLLAPIVFARKLIGK